MNSRQITPETNRLHYRETNVISKDECARSLGSMGQFLTNGNMCTQNPIKNGVCTADSGGPIACQGHYLKGIYSWNSSCMNGKPDVYTEISAYSKWINNEIK